MSKKSEQELSIICRDKISGSRDLLCRINSYLLRNYDKIVDFNSLIGKLESSFNTFQTINQYFEKVKSYGGFTPKLICYLYSYEKKSLMIMDNLYKKSFPILKKYNHFLTISNSSTLLQIFSRLKDEGHRFQVTVCESRPKLEGRVFTRDLVKSGIKSSLITEAQSACFAEKCDCVIFGADIILRNGNVVNKAGSKMLAILARHYKKPVLVIADKSKKSSRIFLKQDVQDSSEIWKNPPPGVRINNNYFELITRSLITKLIID